MVINLSNIYLDIPSTIVLDTEFLMLLAELSFEVYMGLGFVTWIISAIYEDYSQGDYSRFNPLIIGLFIFAWYPLVMKESLNYSNMRARNKRYGLGRQFEMRNRVAISLDDPDVNQVFDEKQRINLDEDYDLGRFLGDCDE